MLAPIYQITRRRFPEDRILHIHRISYWTTCWCSRFRVRYMADCRWWKQLTNSELLFVI